MFFLLLLSRHTVNRWFRQSKYASFQRQLNMYRFTRITTGRDKNGYHHPYFLRGREDLTRRILRLPRDGTGFRRTPVLDLNFYTLSPGTNNDVVRIANDDNDIAHTIDTIVPLPSLPTLMQQPLESITTSQVNYTLNNLLPSRNDHAAPSNTIFNLDRASRYLPPILSTADPFLSSRLNPIPPNAIHNYSNLLSTYTSSDGAVAINPMASTDSSILDRLLSSSVWNRPPAAAVVLNPTMQPHHLLVPNVSSYPPLDDWTTTYPPLPLVNIDIHTLERWIAQQHDQSKAIELLQLLRQL
jgi:HSF-type DNA-binding